MPKSFNQKLKILHLMRLLLERSDEAHPLSMEQILTFLEAQGIAAERKSVYDDMEALRQFGLDIVFAKTRPAGYYLASRTFETPELKLLVDSVQSSQFITEKKTTALIKKLESLGSVYEAQLLRRQVYVRNRIKHMNESIYYNVDKIHSGIAQNKKICFHYFEYTVDKKRSYRHGGVQYCISPFALTWDNENYYLIAYDSAAGMLKHYRVDRMEHIELDAAEREGEEAFRALDMGIYTRRTFSMFGGKSEYVRIEFENHLAGVVIDRFGKDVVMHKTDGAHFQISAPVMVSPQFHAWIFGLGGGARLLGPQEVVDGMRAHLAAVSTMYGTAAQGESQA